MNAHQYEYLGSCSILNVSIILKFQDIKLYRFFINEMNVNSTHGKYMVWTRFGSFWAPSEFHKIIKRIYVFQAKSNQFFFWVPGTKTIDQNYPLQSETPRSKISFNSESARARSSDVNIWFLQPTTKRGSFGLYFQNCEISWFVFSFKIREIKKKSKYYLFCSDWLANSSKPPN